MKTLSFLIPSPWYLSPPKNPGFCAESIYFGVPSWEYFYSTMKIGWYNPKSVVFCIDVTIKSKIWHPYRYPSAGQSARWWTGCGMHPIESDMDTRNTMGFEIFGDHFHTNHHFCWGVWANVFSDCSVPAPCQPAWQTAGLPDTSFSDHAKTATS